VHQVFSQTLATPENLGMASAGKSARMGNLLLLFQEAQKRNPHAERPKKPRTDAQR